MLRRDAGGSVTRCVVSCLVLYYITRGLLLSFLVEYSYKEDVNLTHLFCLKDANGSAHGHKACPLPVGMYLLDTFSGKKEVAT